MKKYLLVTLFFSFIINAQNLLPNGGFDEGTSGWTHPYPDNFQINWDANDGNQNNGSMLLTTLNNSNNVNIAESTQIEVIAGKTYHLQAWIKPTLDTDTEGGSLWVNWYDGEVHWPIGRGDGLFVFTSDANGDWKKVEGDFQFPDSVKFISISPGISIQENNNSIASSVKFDDISFTLKSDDSSAFAMLPSHSALWYNHDQSGHGINVYMLANQRVIVIWYVYDDFGNPLWLLGVGTHDGFKATIDVSINTGAMFPPNFDPDDVIRADWGKFELEFTSCNNGNFKWIPVDGNGFSAGEMSIQRLSTTSGLTCSE